MITTPRLRLRALSLDDCPRIHELANHPKIAERVAAIAHPYPPGAAAKWIAPQAEQWTQCRGLAAGIEADGELIGALSLETLHVRRIELSYWLGEPFWGMGYMSEAMTAFLPYSLTHLPIDLIHARCQGSNPASARVLEKCGFIEIASRTPKLRHFERHR